MKRISLVVPCYNEAQCIDAFIAAIDTQKLRAELEFVFVDDGSQDETLAAIKAKAVVDKRVHYVSFSRNFGKEAALLAGLERATGDYVVTMDADLQHSPSLLSDMEAAIVDEGYDCVAARRTNREGEPALRSWFAHRFYWLMDRFSDVALVDGAMDYRMMTRQVVTEILRLRETLRFTKGIYQWVGFKTKWLDTVNVQRVAGESKWSFWALFRYSITGILAFSTAPLQIASVIGGCVSCAAFLYMSVVFIKCLLYGDPVAGWPTLICVVMLLGGIQLFVIGVLGTYVSQIFKEVKRRPAYVIKESA